MSDENKELSFTISTKAELAGAAATAQSLEMQIGKAKALGKDYSELSDQLKRVRTAMDEADPSAKTVGETVEKTTGQSRAFHTVLGELNRLIPGLGHALHPVAEAYIESGHAAEAGAEGGMMTGPVWVWAKAGGIAHKARMIARENALRFIGASVRGS